MCILPFFSRLSSSDDAFLPFVQLGHVEGRRAREFDPVQAFVGGGTRHGFEIPGGMDDGLRRNAAANEAGAAELVGFDQRGIEPQLAGADRRHIAARPTADDEDLCVNGLHGYSGSVTRKIRHPLRLYYLYQPISSVLRSFTSSCRTISDRIAAGPKLGGWRKIAPDQSSSSERL
jgi:hypothetical protein